MRCLLKRKLIAEQGVLTRRALVQTKQYQQVLLVKLRGALVTFPNKLPPIVPRIDVADDFVKVAKSNGGYSFKYGDPTTHGLEAYVTKNGVLTMDIRANEGLASEMGSGTDMAASLMNRLTKEGIEVKQFDAMWQKGSKAVSTNYHFYNKNYRLMGQLEAARQTWTGQFFAKYGFDIVEPPVITNTPMKTYSASFVKVQP